MNSKDPSELEWEAERYVLKDPTLDRDEFEARMLDDVELALAVADATERLQVVRACCRGEEHVVAHKESAKQFNWLSAALLTAMAASLLLAIAAWRLGKSHSSMETLHVAESETPDLDENVADVDEWMLALSLETSLPVTDIEVADEAADWLLEEGFDSPRDESEPDTLAPAVDDWMLIAAELMADQDGTEGDI